MKNNSDYCLTIKRFYFSQIRQLYVLLLDMEQIKQYTDDDKLLKETTRWYKLYVHERDVISYKWHHERPKTMIFSTYETLKIESDYYTLLQRAYYLLQQKNYSFYQLTQKLKLCASVNIVERVIQTIREKNYIDETRMIEQVIERLQAKNKTLFQIKQALRKYQFPKHMIEPFLSDYHIEEDVVFEKYLKIAQRKYAQKLDKDILYRKQRVMQFLYRQGLQQHIIKKIMCELK